MSRIIQFNILLFLLLAAARLVAQQAQSPGNGADACALVPKAEIEKIMGISLIEGTKDEKMQRQGVLSTCDYSTSDGGQLSILIRQTKVKYVPGSEKTEFEKAGMTLRYVEGLGAAAFFSDIAGLGTGLNVFRGDYDYVLITAMSVGPVEKISPNMEKLARILLERWK
jgi:hypothetical protein